MVTFYFFTRSNNKESVTVKTQKLVDCHKDLIKVKSHQENKRRKMLQSYIRSKTFVWF